MNKFTLFFIDKRIETLYQAESLSQIRIQHFNLLTKGYIAAFFFRCLSFLINSDLNRFYPNLSMLIFFILLQTFLKRSTLSLRILSVIANHVLTIFFYIYDEENDAALSHLKGINQMGSCFIITMGNEFPEALFQVFSLSSIRIFFVLHQSQTLSLYPITNLLIVSIFYLFFHYKYNQAMRAQFMLLQKDSQWERILTQLINKECYIIINFNENSFQFEYLMANNAFKGLENKDQIFNFLKEAQYEKQSLNNFLYQQIKLYHKNRIDLCRQEILIKYQREQVKLEFSIFFANQPTILLVFLKPKLMLVNNSENFNNKVISQYLLKVLKCLKNKYKSKPSYCNFMQKIRLVEIYGNLQSDWQTKIQEIDLWNVISEQVKYFPKINVIYNSITLIIFQTNQDILSLVLFKIFSNTNTSLIILKYQFLEEDRIQLNFSGSFNEKAIHSFFMLNEEHLIRFVELRHVTNYSIEICFEKLPSISFTGNQINQQNLNNQL
ncbi:unnamed protein product [Paramecium sonneborni]|uniref:Transmembrane protein n=1 Tax=Paramecium sonneborni TaxID=65129 RepID=A0A8S1QVA6_9CILI|nr:unnamed protein product [Paramecium sonneborni]